MNLTASTGAPGQQSDTCACNLPANLPTPWALRAGVGNGLPLCPGEVNFDMPGFSSFFDIFCEIDLPTLGTLYNTDALLVFNENLGGVLPPNVVYRHEDSPVGAIPVYFKTAGSKNGVSWVAGEQFGYLTLAGHGASFTCPDCGTFIDKMVQIEQQYGELPIRPKVPSTTKWGLIGLGLLLASTALWIISRKRATNAS